MSTTYDTPILDPKAQQALAAFEAYRDRYRYDPVAFVREVFAAEPDVWQKKVLEAIARGDRRISVRSGHGVGKSTVASWAAIWYLLTRYPVKIVITAPTKAQLYDALYAELRTWIDKLPPELAQFLEVKSDSVIFTPSPAGAFISVRTSRAETPEAMAGVHSENVMLIGDEASGIPEQVYEAAAGSMSGENAVTLLFGNPVRSSGYFFDTHHKVKHLWTTFHVSCEDSSRVSREWIEEMRVKYGERSNPYRVRVLGEFPLADDNTIIPYEYVASSLGRDVEVLKTTPRVWGLDVGRGGDPSAIVERQGRKVNGPPRRFGGLDTMELVGRIYAEYDSLPTELRPSDIFVDVIGVGGPVYDRLRELGLPVRGVNVSESPALKGGSYHNLRAELWYAVRAWFAGRDVSLPALETLTGAEREAMDLFVEDLVSIQNDFAEATGKILAESKKKIRKRMGRSIDAGDALMLTFAGPATIATHGRDHQRHWSKPIKRNLRGIV